MTSAAAQTPDISTSSYRRQLLPRDPIVRLLSVNTLVNTFGNGLFFTISALFFTRIVGLSVTQVGLGLTIAGALGVAAGVPLGHLADRVGVRHLLVVLVFTEGIAMVLYTQVHSFAIFLPVVCLATIVDRGSNAVRGALLAVVLPAETRTQTRAYLRAVTNVGIGAGSSVATVALVSDTRAAYVAMVLANAATFIGSACILMRLPAVGRAKEQPTSGASRRGALTDVPYLTVSGLNAILSIQFGILEIGVPLWIVSHTHAPRALVAVTLILNTIMVVLFQVRASRGMTSISAAARAARRAGLILAAACLLYAGASGIPAWVAAVALIAGAAVQTIGEVLSSAAGWALSYDLADPAAPGAYQGVYSSGFALSAMLAPLLVTSTAIHLGRPGWALLAAMFVFAGAALVPASRWAATTGRRALTD